VEPPRQRPSTGSRSRIAAGTSETLLPQGGTAGRNRILYYVRYVFRRQPPAPRSRPRLRPGLDHEAEPRPATAPHLRYLSTDDLATKIWRPTFAGGVAAPPIPIPADVRRWLSNVFARCNGRIADTMTQVPIQEGSLDIPSCCYPD
jgi:hypothetical protein